MKAILYTGGAKAWVDALGDIPWALLPVANRPLIEYWLESCAELDISDVQIVLEDGAEQIEAYVEDGIRWGLQVQYSFARMSEAPVDYLKQSLSESDEGVFFVSDWLFVRRLEGFLSASFDLEAMLCLYDDTELKYLFCRNGATVREALARGEDGPFSSELAFEELNVEPCFITDLNGYYQLNMKLVGGEFARYVTSGFADKEGSSVGYNVLTPPSVRLQAPLIIGNDCRMGALSTIGPNAVISDHVIVDTQSELTNCLILPDTYIGRNLEIDGKIVSGNRLISPDDGTVLEIEDSWVVAQNRPEMTSDDVFRFMVLWVFGALLALIQLIPFCLLFFFILVLRKGTFHRRVFHDSKLGSIRIPMFRKRVFKRSYLVSLFKACALDKFPQLLMALTGRLFVCGQKPLRHPEDDALVPQIPLYLPAVFYYSEYNRDNDALVDALWYAHARSLFEDVKILIKSLLYRFFRAGR